jgi:hypothetical protein
MPRSAADGKGKPKAANITKDGQRGGETGTRGCSILIVSVTNRGVSYTM